MKILKFTIFFLLLSSISCEKENFIDTNGLNYVPRDVFVKVKSYYTIDQVFLFINSLNHNVEDITSQVYTSDLHSNQLQYVLDYINAKNYTNDGFNYVNGYLHYLTNEITIFPELYNMHKTRYQEDWLETMEILKLKEDTTRESGNCIIHFKVPIGKEKEWESKFKEYDFVEWVELNYYMDGGI